MKMKKIGPGAVHSKFVRVDPLQTYEIISLNRSLENPPFFRLKAEDVFSNFLKKILERHKSIFGATDSPVLDFW